MPRYDIVPERSQVWIDARSSLHPIHSQTSGLEGYIDAEVGSDGRVDVSVPPHARLSLAVDRLSSGNVFEDRELKRRVLARRFPTIIGELTAMSHANDNGTYVVRGDVTFRGETHGYESPMEIQVVDDRSLRLTGMAIFDIRDFGMEAPRILMLRVEPEVTVRVDIIATDQS